MIKKLFLTVLLILSLTGNVRADSIAESYETQNDDTAVAGGTGGAGSGENRQQIAQTFSHSSTFTCSQVAVYIRKVGSPTDNIILDIQTISGGVPSGTLANANATKSIDASTISATIGWVTFTFPATFSLTGSTTYAIVLRRSGSRSTTNVIRWGNDYLTAVYLNGSFFGMTETVWSENFLTVDFDFRVYESTAVSTPSMQVIWIN